MNSIAKLVCGLLTGLTVAACSSSAPSQAPESNGADLTSANQTGGTCVSGEDGPCGGFIINPCVCGPGLVCVPNHIPDLPGSCQPKTCCPVGWDMRTCTDEDGGAQVFTCHNPALACAESIGCGGDNGQGCNFEVTRRCRP
jgi:hypothetical protein